MPTLVARIVLTCTPEEVAPARRTVVERVRAWGVPLDDEAVETIGLIASELITNAVVHGRGPVSVALYHRPGHLIIDVLDGNRAVPLVGTAGNEDESGRGVALVCRLAERSGWELTDHGKRVWAEIAIPKPAPAIRATVLRRFFARRSNFSRSRTTKPLSLTVSQRGARSWHFLPCGVIADCGR